MNNSADLGGCYPPRPSASVDDTLLDLQNASYPTQPHSIIAIYSPDLTVSRDMLRSIALGKKWRTISSKNYDRRYFRYCSLLPRLFCLFSRLKKTLIKEKPISWKLFKGFINKLFCLYTNFVGSFVTRERSSRVAEDPTLLLSVPQSILVIFLVHMPLQASATTIQYRQKLLIAGSVWYFFKCLHEGER